MVVCDPLFMDVPVFAPAEGAARGIRAPRIIPDEAAGTIIGATHGHVFRKGKGHDWWARQAHARHRIAAADILLTGHYHHLRIEQDGDRLWMQAPTVDTGSPWYDQRHGGRSTPGTLTFWTSHGHASDISVI